MARPKVATTKQPGIYKLTYPSGQVRYRVHVHRDGKQTTGTFHAFNDAVHFKRTNDSHHDTKGLPFTNRLLEKTSLRSVVDRYREGGVNIRGKALGSTELVYTKKFSQWLEDNDDPSLTAFDEEMASDYVDELLASTWRGKGWKGSAQQVAPSSVRRHINAIQPIWKMARRKWRFKGLENPFEDTDIEGSDVISMRHLKPDELEKLLNVAREYGKGSVYLSLHRFYVPLSLHLALHTGMRREEIFDLTWEHTDWQNRRIFIRKAKKGPRLIVMPVGIYLELTRIMQYLGDNSAFNPSDYVMYPKETAIGTKGKMKGKRLAIQNNEEALWEIRKKAGLYIEDRKDRWTFRCLRKEAEARFLAVLTVPEADRMMGHKNNKNMAMRYWVTNNEDLIRIQDKLDRSVLKGETFKEFIDKNKRLNNVILEGHMKSIT
jgi:integrase